MFSGRYLASSFTSVKLQDLLLKAYKSNKAATDAMLKLNKMIGARQFQDADTGIGLPIFMWHRTLDK